MTVSAPTAPHARSGDDVDRALAARAGSGDERAFAELYDRHAAGLLAFSSQYVGDRAAAEDVVQQTFLAAYRTLSAGTALEHPRAWLYHVARNNALTTIRDRGPAGVDAALAAELHDRAAAVPAQVERREALHAVVRDIAALPAEQRAALALYELGDLSQAEIADTLGCTPARVKALVFQARSSLVTQRDARDASCATVREKLATFHGGALNHRLIRQHLHGCEACAAYRDELRDQRRRVALLLPLVPAPGLRGAVLGLFGGGAAASTSSAGAGGLLAPRWLATGAATTVAVAGVALSVWPSGDAPRKVPPRVTAAAAPLAAQRVAARPSVARKVAPAHHRATGRKAAPPQARRVRTAVPALDRRASARGPAGPAPRPAPDPVRKVTPRAPPAQTAPAATPEPAPTAHPAPAIVAAPQPTSAPEPPAAPASPPAACADHSHASVQGLAQGEGHGKCKGG